MSQLSLQFDTRPPPNCAVAHNPLKSVSSLARNRGRSISRSQLAAEINEAEGAYEAAKTNLAKYRTTTTKQQRAFELRRKELCATDTFAKAYQFLKKPGSQRGLVVLHLVTQSERCGLVGVSVPKGS